MVQDDRADGWGCASFIQITCPYLMSHILSYKKLPLKLQKRSLNLLRFWCGIANYTTKWMGKLLAVAFANW